jgi:hypothetical protein
LLGLINDDDESAYREEVLAPHCQDINLSLNVSKTNKHAFTHINESVVERVESFKFLGVHFTKELTWSTDNHTDLKRAQQCLFPLGSLKRFDMGSRILKKI